MLSLAACGGGLLGKDVIAQAEGSDGQIAFDVVKIDDAVLTTLLDRPQASFTQTFQEIRAAAGGEDRGRRHDFGCYLGGRG